MRDRSLLTVGLTTLCALGLASSAAAGTQVLKDIPFAETTDVRAAVREQCKLGTKLAGFIAESNASVELVEKLGGGSVLVIHITEVHAPGGGAFSGPKWLESKGTLKKGGKAVASFRAKRFTTGGVFGAFKGTCAIIARTTKVMGQDIGAWLENPEDGAELGDAR